MLAVCAVTRTNLDQGSAGQPKKFASFADTVSTNAKESNVIKSKAAEIAYAKEMAEKTFSVQSLTL